MNLIDLHCDTLWKLLDLDKRGDLADNGCSVSIPAMRVGNTLAQFFACFVYTPHMPGENQYERYENGYRHVLEMASYLKSQISEYSDEMASAGSAEDICRNREQNKISAVLTVEEGGILNGMTERIDELYLQGVRLMTIMWNYENCIGHPNSRDPEEMNKGLKPFGVEVVRRMNEKGMVIDASHASDKTFWDVLKYSSRPVVASHSNCREVCSHPRNLTDEMIRALAEKGGAAGLNFYGPFLGTSVQSRIEEMVCHLRHMINTGGSDFPAIGTDFDGFDGMEKLEIPDTGHMGLLRNALEKEGFTAGQIEKIWWGNAMRVMEDMV